MNKSTPIAFLIFALFFYSAATHAGPWTGFEATTPTRNYLRDSGHEDNYQFGFIKSYFGYREPNFKTGLDLPSPLDQEKYRSYNLIIVVNENENEPDPVRWGPPQSMRVYSREAVNSKGLLYFWNISTGVASARTPKGFYRPQSFSSRHWSKQFNAPMFWAVFFNGGKALHSSLASVDLSHLGRLRTSHGCVHIEDHRAEEVFHLIGHSGYGLTEDLSVDGNSLITKTGEPKLKMGYRTLIIIH